MSGKDDMIDALIRPPRRVYRHPQVKLIGLSHLERTTEYKLKVTGDHALENIVAGKLAPTRL
jgi:hypothetical protein